MDAWEGFGEADCGNERPRKVVIVVEKEPNVTHHQNNNGTGGEIGKSLKTMKRLPLNLTARKSDLLSPIGASQSSHFLAVTFQG